MKPTTRFRPYFTAVALAAAVSQPEVFAQAPGEAGIPALAPPSLTPPPPTPTAPRKVAVAQETKKTTIPMLKLPGGPLTAALEELSTALRGMSLPEMNVIVAPEARSIHAPELLLRNVTGPDALRLIAVSVGCDMEDIQGTDGQPIGYRIFPNAQLVGTPTEAPGTPDGSSGLAKLPLVGRLFEPAPASAQPEAPVFPGGAGAMPMLGTPTRTANYLSFPPMPTEAPPSVHVYNLGSITTTVKFAEVEATLLDVLKAAGVPANAAKIAFHEKTNVLLVTGDQTTHAMVRQYLEALQKNASEAAEQNKHENRANHEVLQYKIRMDAEQNERRRLEKMLEQTESQLREVQRELDRARTGAPKGQ